MSVLQEFLSAMLLVLIAFIVACFFGTVYVLVDSGFEEMGDIFPKNKITVPLFKIILITLMVVCAFAIMGFAINLILGLEEVDDESTSTVQLVEVTNEEHNEDSNTTYYIVAGRSIAFIENGVQKIIFGTEQGNYIIEDGRYVEDFNNYVLKMDNNGTPNNCEDDIVLKVYDSVVGQKEVLTYEST